MSSFLAADFNGIIYIFKFCHNDPISSYWLDFMELIKFIILGDFHNVLNKIKLKSNSQSGTLGSEKPSGI